VDVQDEARTGKNKGYGVVMCVVSRAALGLISKALAAPGCIFVKDSKLQGMSPTRRDKNRL